MNFARRRSEPDRSAVLRFAPSKIALGKEPRVAETPSKRQREKSAPSNWARAVRTPRKLTSVSFAPARFASASEQPCMDDDLNRAPARNTFEKSRPSRRQFSRIAPAAEAPFHFVASRGARVKSAPSTFAPEKSARVRSARFRSFSARSFPARLASVRSGVTLELRALQLFHSDERRRATCSGLGMRAGLYDGGSTPTSAIRYSAAVTCHLSPVTHHLPPTKALGR